MADPMCLAQASAASVALVVPVVAGLTVFSLTTDTWLQVRAEPPAARHELLAEFGPFQARLNVRFLKDPASPSRQALPQLKIPWMPLKHFLGGPPAVSRFRKHLAPVGGANAAPGAREIEFIVSDALDRSEEVRDWDIRPFEPLAQAAHAVQICGCTIVTLLLCALTSQATAAAMLVCNVERREGLNTWPLGPRLASTVAAVLYLSAAAAASWGAVRFTSAGHAVLKPLVSEFLVVVTDGDAVIWPADMYVKMGPGVFALAFAGAVAFLMGLILLLTDYEGSAPERGRDKTPVRAARVVPKQMSPTTIVPIKTVSPQVSSRGIKLEAIQPLTIQEKLLFASALEVTRAKIARKNKRLAAWIIFAMLAFVVLLTVVGFLLGRRVVVQGLQNALRGPQLTVKQTKHAFQKVRHDIQEVAVSTGNATRIGVDVMARSARGGSITALEGLKSVGGAARAASSALVAAVRNHDWKAMLQSLADQPKAVLRGLAHGLTEFLHWLRSALRGAHQSVEDRLKDLQQRLKKLQVRRLRRKMQLEEPEVPSPPLGPVQHWRWPWSKEAKSPPVEPPMGPESRGAGPKGSPSTTFLARQARRHA